MKANFLERSAELRKTAQFEEFLTLLPKLNAIEFFGIVKMLGVEVRDINKTGEQDGVLLPTRPVDDIFDDMMNKFLDLSEKGRKKILKLMREIVG